MRLHFGGPTIHPAMPVVWLMSALVVVNLPAFLSLPSYLRDKYPAKWEALRCPGLFGGPAGSRMMLLGFVWFGDVSRMADARLALSVWTARIATIAFAAVVAWQYWVAYR